MIMMNLKGIKKKENGMIMIEELREEIIVLKSIYCLPGEVQVTSDANGVTEITLNIHHGNENQFKPQTKVVISIPSKYPLDIPNISLFSENIDAKNIKDLHQKLYNHAEKCTGSPMLMDLIDLLQQEIINLPVLSNTMMKMECNAPRMSGGTNSLSSTEDGRQTDVCIGRNLHQESVSVLLLHIDHMRAKNKYIKLIERWVKELQLTGRLLFCNRLILLLLQGEPDVLKEYLTKHKTSVVDVDSKGRPCKEKMLSVLCNQELDNKTRFSDFQVVENSSLKDLQQAFEEYKMDDLFDNYVLQIKGMKLS